MDMIVNNQVMVEEVMVDTNNPTIVGKAAMEVEIIMEAVVAVADMVVDMEEAGVDMVVGVVEVMAVGMVAEEEVVVDIVEEVVMAVEAVADTEAVVEAMVVGVVMVVEEVDIVEAVRAGEATVPESPRTAEEVASTPSDSTEMRNPIPESSANSSMLVILKPPVSTLTSTMTFLWR